MTMMLSRASAPAASLLAARSRAHGPTVELWHAVEVHRAPAEIDGACELTLCGVLARVEAERAWPVTEHGTCPACVALTR